MADRCHLFDMGLLTGSPRKIILFSHMNLLRSLPAKFKETWRESREIERDDVWPTNVIFSRVYGPLDRFSYGNNSIFADKHLNKLACKN